MSNVFSKWLALLSPGKAGDMPSRNADLLLDLPIIRSHSKLQAAKSNQKPPQDFWKSLNAHPIELLRDIDRHLKRINTACISEVRRFDWVEQSLQFACPAMRKIFSEQYKLDALPESHDRREGLVTAINVCHQLGTGFKRQFLNDYTSSDAKYRQTQARVRVCTLRIFELARMEQRLRSMRYQKLSASTWRDCNRIFFAFAQCEDITESHQALTCLHVRLDSKAREQGRIQATITSVRHMYLAIQLYGLIDTDSISSRNMHMVDAYLLKIINSLSIKPDDGSPLLTGEVIIYSNQKTSAFFKRQSDNFSVTESAISEKVLALRIDLIPLEILLMKEQKKLIVGFEAEQEGQEKAVVDQDDLARLSVVDVMCDRLRLKERKEKRENVAGKKILYVYNGFMSAYKFLVDTALQDEDENEGQELAADNELRDVLAGHSALIASDVASSGCDQWRVLDRSAGGVHIKTEESQFTTAMFVGQILAFSFSREEMQHPALGYVTRLSRGAVGDIEVTIQTLSRHPVATAIQSEFLSKNDMAFPAILLKNDDNEEIAQIILHHSHHLSPGTIVQVELDGNQSGCVIAELLQMQREFVVYGLSQLKNS